MCWILFSYFIFFIVFFFFHFQLGSDPRNCFPHSHFKGNLMLQQGPWGKHFGKTAPTLSFLSFFSLRKRKEKKRGGKGGERSTQSGETWSWERLGFRKEGGVAASFFFMSQGLSVSTQPQKYLTLQSWYLVIIFFCCPLPSCPHQKIPQNLSWFGSVHHKVSGHLF